VVAEGAGELNWIRQNRQSLNKYRYELAAILARKTASDVTRHYCLFDGKPQRSKKTKFAPHFNSDSPSAG
jgi:hypothetical protein